MTLAGKHGIGIISIGSLSEEGLNALPTQWGFAEAAAAKHCKTVDRKNWRVLLSWHIAETREKARAEARDGLMRHHNEYIAGTLQRPGARPLQDTRRGGGQDRVLAGGRVHDRHTGRSHRTDQIGS